MSYSRTGCLIDSVNGRRDGGYRRHPHITSAPLPEDYATTADYQDAQDHWDDEPGRPTVASPWYAFASLPGDADELVRYTAARLIEIRDSRSWLEIPGYHEATPPQRAQLRMIVEEFLYDHSRETRNNLQLVIL